jgi:hypothetical protein
MLHELRIYRCVPGRLPDVSKRFETTAMKYWTKHGVKPIAFWTTQIGPSNQDIYYILEWKDLAERERNWNAFIADPDWNRERLDSEKGGPMVESIQNVILAPTAYSKLK